MSSLVIRTEHKVAVQRAVGNLAGRHAVHLTGQGASAIQHLQCKNCQFLMPDSVNTLPTACLPSTAQSARQQSGRSCSPKEQNAIDIPCGGLRLPHQRGTEAPRCMSSNSVRRSCRLALPCIPHPPMCLRQVVAGCLGQLALEHGTRAGKSVSQVRHATACAWCRACRQHAHFMNISGCMTGP